MLCREKSLLLELGFQLLKGQLCGADAIRKHFVHIDLKRAVPLVKSSTAAHDHLHAFLRPEAEPPCIRAEHHRLDAGSCVPKGKIAVAAAGILYKVCDLAPQRQIKQDVVCIQQGLDVLVQGRDRPPVPQEWTRRWRCRWNTVRAQNTPAEGAAAPSCG